MQNYKKYILGAAAVLTSVCLLGYAVKKRNLAHELYELIPKERSQKTTKVYRNPEGTEIFLKETFETEDRNNDGNPDSLIITRYLQNKAGVLVEESRRKISLESITDKELKELGIRR